MCVACGGACVVELCGVCVSWCVCVVGLCMCVIVCVWSVCSLWVVCVVCSVCGFV